MVYNTDRVYTPRNWKSLHRIDHCIGRLPRISSSFSQKSSHVVCTSTMYDSVQRTYVHAYSSRVLNNGAPIDDWYWFFFSFASLVYWHTFGTRVLPSEEWPLTPSAAFSETATAADRYPLPPSCSIHAALVTGRDNPVERNVWKLAWPRTLLRSTHTPWTVYEWWLENQNHG